MFTGYFNDQVLFLMMLRYITNISEHKDFITYCRLVFLKIIVLNAFFKKKYKFLGEVDKVFQF